MPIASPIKRLESANNFLFRLVLLLKSDHELTEVVKIDVALVLGINLVD